MSQFDQRKSSNQQSQAGSVTVEAYTERLDRYAPGITPERRAELIEGYKSHLNAGKRIEVDQIRANGADKLALTQDAEALGKKHGLPGIFNIASAMITEMGGPSALRQLSTDEKIQEALKAVQKSFDGYMKEFTERGLKVGSESAERFLKGLIPAVASAFRINGADRIKLNESMEAASASAISRLTQPS